MEQPEKQEVAHRPKSGGKDSPKAQKPQEKAPFIARRLEVWDRVKKPTPQWPDEDIEVRLGADKEGKKFKLGSTPIEIAGKISTSLAKRVIVARVDGELWDLQTPLERSCHMEFLDFETPEGKMVFWHSTAHILGEAAEEIYGCKLAGGPPTEDGFYYDMRLPEGGVVQQADWKRLEKAVEQAVKEKQKFERLKMSKKELLEMFDYNEYKQRFIADKVAEEGSTVYRNGPFIDLCRGPHVPHTGYIKAFSIMKNSASYFLGDANNDSLQRIYGVSFPDKKKLDEYKKYLEEAAKRDHRKIGQDQELFMIDEMSPGSPFFLRDGVIIYNALRAFLRKQYRKRKYQEVRSPSMFNADLWKQSGHWAHYKDDMFTFEVEKAEWALKPMNCPAHCRIFDHRVRSYRELPMRMADFGVLHRNEASGALTGLTRVRRFEQDDAHIFCTEEQISQEILGLFDFLKTVYDLFGFTFKMKLSTRPEGFLGEVETWDNAEARLKEALDGFCNENNMKWDLNPGDGAFYGPKIDIKISDALKRDHQCATIQLDFQLPQQFNLEYVTGEASSKPKTDGAEAENKEKPDVKKEAKKEVKVASLDELRQARKQKKLKISDIAENCGIEEEVCFRIFDGTAEASAQDLTKLSNLLCGDPLGAPNYRKQLTPGYARPVMIHRAIFGSFERFMAILMEHFAGRWPFWLSPRQVLVVPVMPSVNDYVLEVQALFDEHDINIDVDVSADTMKAKIRNGQLAQYNFIFVVGAQEKESRTVNIRNRDDQATQAKGELIPLDEALEKMLKLRDSRALENKL